MRCNEVHNGLNQKEIRDFLGMALVKAHQDEVDNKKKITQHTGGDEDFFEWKALIDGMVQWCKTKKGLEALFV